MAGQISERPQKKTPNMRAHPFNSLLLLTSPGHQALKRRLQVLTIAMVYGVGPVVAPTVAFRNAKRTRQDSVRGANTGATTLKTTTVTQGGTKNTTKIAQS